MLRERCRWTRLRCCAGKVLEEVSNRFKSSVYVYHGNSLTANYVLFSTNKIKVPEWVDVVKLSTANELAPCDPDWFYVRCAAILRHLYLRPTGITGLSKVFGRSKRYGVSPRHHVNAYTGILRRCLRELESLGLVDKRADGYGFFLIFLVRFPLVKNFWSLFLVVVRFPAPGDAIWIVLLSKRRGLLLLWSNSHGHRINMYSGILSY